MDFFVFQIREAEGAAVSTTSPSLFLNGSIHLSHVEFLLDAKQRSDIKTTHPCPGFYPVDSRQELMM